MVVVADTLRRDHLGFYGYVRDTSVQLDAFARDSLVFDQAFSQSPSTKPSIASLFSSRFPTQHGAIYNEDTLRAEFITLAEVLQHNDYATAAFVENPMIGANFGFDQGFDKWFLDPRRHKDGGADHDATMDDFDAAVRSWLGSQGSRPFFLYLHFIDPHSPYDAPAAFRGYYASNEEKPEEHLRVGSNAPSNIQPLIDHYDEEIRYVDHRFGRMIESLRTAGFLDETIVVFLSDHGEGLGDHRKIHHSYATYGELINIPFLIRYPRVFAAGRTNVPAQHVDLFPTILDLVGVDSSPFGLQGDSLVSLLDGTEPRGPCTAIVSEHLRDGWGFRQRAIIEGRWKLVEILDWGVYELFDFKEDPLDQINLLRPWDLIAASWIHKLGAGDGQLGPALRALLESEKVRLASHMMGTMSQCVAQLGEQIAGQKAEINAEATEQLRALGYIQ